MKRKALIAAVLALVLAVVPVSGYATTVFAATGTNNPGTGTNNPGTGTETPDTDKPDTETPDTDKPDGSGSGNNTEKPVTPAPSTPSTPPASTDNYMGTAVTVTNSQGQAVVSSIGTINTSAEVKSVAVTTPRASINAVAGLTADMVAMGQDVQVTVAGSQCGPLAKQAIDNAAASAGGSVATILEIDIAIVQARNGVVVQDLTELSTPVEFSISTPVNVENPENYDFAMVRIHDGQATILPDLDNDPATITFQTDKFSPYAVIYGAKGSFDAFKTGKVKDSVPKTGSGLPVAVPFAAAGVVLAATAVILKKRER